MRKRTENTFATKAWQQIRDKLIAMGWIPPNSRLVEWPARCISLRFTHPTCGDEIFCFMVEKAVAEYAALNRCDGPKSFTASNDVIVECFIHDQD